MLCEYDERVRECEGDSNAGVGDGGGVLAVSSVCERGLGIVSCADDVLEKSVVRGMRGVGGVCEICMCLVREGWGVRGEWVRGFGLGFNNHVGTGGVLDVSLCLDCVGVCSIGGGGWCLVSASGRLGVVMSVCCESVLYCVDGRSMYLFSVLDGYLYVFVCCISKI